MLERGIRVDHSTIYRWVIKYSPELEENFRKHHKRAINNSWRMDETYIKVRGKWCYLYRAVDKFGASIDFYLSKNRDKNSAKCFFDKAIGQHGYPEKVTIDKSGSNKSALKTINIFLLLVFMFTGRALAITVRAIKYLNNIVEQDHRFIKRLVKPMLGFKAFGSAHATLAGIELHHMLRKGQHAESGQLSVPEQFYALAA